MGCIDVLASCQTIVGDHLQSKADHERSIKKYVINLKCEGPMTKCRRQFGEEMIGVFNMVPIFYISNICHLQKYFSIPFCINRFEVMSRFAHTLCE